MKAIIKVSFTKFIFYFILEIVKDSQIFII